MCCVLLVRSGVITRYLCRTTGAQHLPASSVCDLLEAALKNGDGEAFGYICEELPGVQLLRQDHILKLLQVGWLLGLWSACRAAP